jgi:hypothetical protein
MPVLFSPLDPRTLYFASNTLWQTNTGGQSWQQISPDLTRQSWEVPPNVGKYIGTDAARPTRRGVIYTIAPSPIDGNTIWIGSDDGLIHLTRDHGKTWADVTPPTLTPWAKVSLVDASPFDVDTAYAAINTLRLDDLRPHIYRTRDGGKTWQHITAGIPNGGIINAVRADPQQPGLLFAGSEQAVYVSLDNGDHWQSLRLNMPATSIRDLVIKDDDLVVGTHGRSFWILDDITPLRQIRAVTFGTASYLFAPRQAWRFRWNKNTDTPLPPDEPAGDNPPDGATIHYWLRGNAKTVTLEIMNAAGVVRRFSSLDPPETPVEGRNTPDYWLRPHAPLSARAGFHRFVWDLRHERPSVPSFTYPIAAIFRNTPRVPFGSWVTPGTYTVRLTVEGDGAVQLSQSLVVRMDPRVRATPDDIRLQYETSRALDAALRRVANATQGAAGDRTELRRIQGELTQLFAIVEQADAAPTSQVLAAVKSAIAAADSAAR